MKRVCAWCKKVLAEGSQPSTSITHGICAKCAAGLFKTLNKPTQAFIDSLEIPVLVVDGTGLILSANVTMRDCFGKTVAPDSTWTGGELFECDHAGGPRGCGGAEVCEDCGIRRIIAETYRTGEGCLDVRTCLDLRGKTGVRRIWLRVTTEKVADKVLLKVMETAPPIEHNRNPGIDHAPVPTPRAV